jgi:pimeloyl-ACP methyl ester carboxylesterase
VASARIKVDSVRVALERRGSGDAVVLVHGLWCDGRKLADEVGTLGARFHVVAPDLPGWGQSDKPAGWLYSPDGVAAFVVRLARALRLPRYAVLGVGVGRLAAARVRDKDPDRVVAVGALAEPRSLGAVARTLTSYDSVRATRKMLATTRRGAWRADSVPLYERSDDLGTAFAAAFTRAGSGSDEETVDEARERARAEELAQAEPQRKRLRVIS